MRGPSPKASALRQRRNKAATRAQFSTDEARQSHPPDIPPLKEMFPKAKRDWHPMTVAWWADIWKSPMADEFLQADMHGLYRLAVLINNFWRRPERKLAGEIRLQQAAYGLTPLDRRRLEWEVQRAQGEKTEPAQPKPRTRIDPRRVLRAVK